MKKENLLLYVSSGIIVVCVLFFFSIFYGVVQTKPKKIKSLQKKIVMLQEQLIGAQIMTENLKEVQKLITKNLAYSSEDSLAQGASLAFLKDLTLVLDNLHITLVTLEPQPNSSSDRFVESPYKVEILCTYRQFCELVNKMEKSARMISIKEFELENSIETYLNDENLGKDQCRITMEISTLTLVRDAQ